VLAAPSSGQWRILRELGLRSARMVVMAEHGRRLLREVYGVPQEKIALIPHGIPDTDPQSIDRDAVRRELGWAGRRVLLTTGLLSPGKGLCHAVEALPRIVSRHPDVLYVIAGATHPNLVRTEGEAHRESLVQLGQDLGVAEHLLFINQFAAREQLVRMIVASDIFLTPYLNEAQITSGVLAYASGLGRPVISTPYWHARELLDESRGVLVPFASPESIAAAAADLLDDAPRMERMSAAAREKGRLATWSNVGRLYLHAFDEAARTAMPRALPAGRFGGDSPSPHPPLDHLHVMTGPLGVLQHAGRNFPDISHGYCTDDNARALIATQDFLAAGHEDPRLPELGWRCFRFLERAFNRRVRRFRNFCTVQGEWLEIAGSEDSQGRALWALGHAATHGQASAMRLAARGIFFSGLPAALTFISPRAWAFALLGIAAVRALLPAHTGLAAAQTDLSVRLLRMYGETSADEWRWFEDVVSYDNARLPLALLVTAQQTGDAAMRRAALESLEWLMRWQQAPGGHFRPVGCSEVFRRGDPAPSQWDQQPLEALASISACGAAHACGAGDHWRDRARRIFAWFEGDNDMGLPVGDFQTGACHDGLQPGGVNFNQGAESTLALLQASLEMRRILMEGRSPSPYSPVIFDEVG
jgi:hypothetical protein